MNTSKFGTKSIIGLSLLTAWLAAGCSIEPTELAKKQAESWCDNFGGAKSVTYGSITGMRVRCMDDKLIIKDSSS